MTDAPLEPNGWPCVVSRIGNRSRWVRWFGGSALTSAILSKPGDNSGETVNLDLVDTHGPASLSAATVRRPWIRPLRMKRSLWFHLHFWIGWISAVPIAFVCFTGAILAFSESITHWEHRELFQIKASGPRLTISQVLDSYEKAEPRLQVNHLGIPESPSDAYKAYCVQMHPAGRRNMQVYCNPYTGELT